MDRIQADRIRAAVLCDAQGLRARLVYYPPNLDHARHRHDKAQVSLLLVGRLREAAGRCEAEPLRRSGGVKAGGQEHEARFGPEGALMLSIDVDDEALLPWRTPAEWRPVGPSAVASLRRLLEGARDAPDDLCDLLGALGAEAARRRSAAPAAWLRRIREAIDDDPGGVRLGEAARLAGVHRVHLARSFLAAYGVTPSAYRSRVMAARGLKACLSADLSLAAAAADAGFADQSHFCRVFGREAGAPPSQVRRLLRQVSSVQA